MAATFKQCCGISAYGTQIMHSSVLHLHSAGLRATGTCGRVEALNEPTVFPVT